MCRNEFHDCNIVWFVGVEGDAGVGTGLCVAGAWQSSGIQYDASVGDTGFQVFKEDEGEVAVLLD